jgi:cytochrome P450
MDPRVGGMLRVALLEAEDESKRAAFLIEDTLEKLNIFNASTAQKLHEVLAEARLGCPVAHVTSQGGYWVVTTYDDVRRVLHDPRTFSSAQGITLDKSPLTNALIETDPPRHRAYRRLVEGRFSKRALEIHRPAITKAAETIVGRFVGSGRFEACRDFASPLAAGALATIVLGLDFETNLDEIMRVQDAVAAGAAGERQEETIEAYLKSLLERRRDDAEERDDLIGTLLGGTISGKPLSNEDVVGTLRLFLGAGQDTTKAALISIIYRILQSPKLETNVRDGPWLADNVDEFIRLDSPVTGLCRVTTKEVELGNRKLPAGQRLLVLYGSANRDEKAFDDPDALVFDRRTPSLAFGHGIHFCIGANMARMVIEVGMSVLLSRVQHLRVETAAEVEWTPGLIRHPKTLNVSFEQS